MLDATFKLIEQEEKRQEETLMMIPSENHASKSVRKAVGSILTNKYSEGYPGRRYYQGNKIIDEIEELAIKRAKKLFKVPHANVQPYSGSPANSEVLFALVNPGETICGMDLASGGHLTHGLPEITFSGKYFTSKQFSVEADGKINYLRVARTIKKEAPKLIIIGTTAYPLKLDWGRFEEIADSIGAWLVADIAHIAGLVVAGSYPSPVAHVHVVTTTTHKSLRGPRGAIIMATAKGLKKDKALPDKLDRAVFPGMQGGPHNNTTASIAVCLQEASSKSFKKYGKDIIRNAKVLADELIKGGLTLVGGGTECHLILVDLRSLKLSGNVLAQSLEAAGIVVNKNLVPADTMPPFYPSGIRLGTPALTTRGMRAKEMKQIAGWILKVVEYSKPYKLPKNAKARGVFMKGFRKKIAEEKFFKELNGEVKALCKKFPIPQ